MKRRKGGGEGEVHEMNAVTKPLFQIELLSQRLQNYQL